MSIDYRGRNITSAAPIKVGSTKIKAAWIRDDVPAGSPAPGRFDCECGRPVRASYYGQGPDVTCDCGIVYDNHGYITRPDPCEGRTIWNSDGTDGPCLICAP